MAVVSRKHLENIHRPVGSSHLLLTTAIFLLKIHDLLATVAVVALIDLKIPLCMAREHWWPFFMCFVRSACSLP